MPDEVVEVVLVASRSRRVGPEEAGKCSPVLYQGFVLMRQRCLGDGAAKEGKTSRVGCYFSQVETLNGLIAQFARGRVNSTDTHIQKAWAAAALPVDWATTPGHDWHLRSCS